jgi:hypothetical protein
MLLTVLSLEADGAADGLGVAADGLGGAADGLGAVDGLTGTISADAIGALRDRSSLGGGRERERGSVDGTSDCAMMAGTLSSTLSVFFLGGGTPYTSDLFGAALTGP